MNMMKAFNWGNQLSTTLIVISIRCLLVAGVLHCAGNGQAQ